MPHDHVQKIKFLTPPQGPRGWGTQKIVSVGMFKNNEAFHFMASHTHA